MRRLIMPLVAIAFALATNPDAAHARRVSRTTCPDGRFLLAQPIALEGSATVLAAVVLDGKKVSFDDQCSMSPMKTRVTKKGQKFRSRVSDCDRSLGLKVKLRGKIDKTCSYMTGKVKIGRVKKKFRATRSWCGDAKVDSRGGEQCESSKDCAWGSVCNPYTCGCVPVGGPDDPEGPGDPMDPEQPDSAPYCGDGHKDAGEQCDDGAYNNNTKPDHCRKDCKLPRCGDGVLDHGDEICVEDVLDKILDHLCMPVDLDLPGPLSATLCPAAPLDGLLFPICDGKPGCRIDVDLHLASVTIDRGLKRIHLVLPFGTTLDAYLNASVSLIGASSCKSIFRSTGLALELVLDYESDPITGKLMCGVLSHGLTGTLESELGIYTAASGLGHLVCPVVDSMSHLLHPVFGSHCSNPVLDLIPQQIATILPDVF